MLNFLNFRFYLVALSIWPCISINAYYYCDKEDELCGGGKHFMCNPDDVVSSSYVISTWLDQTNLFDQPSAGEVLGLMPLTRKIKRLYIERHNKHRNTLAGGEQEFKGGGKFPKATRMREVVWDDELAYIAGIHAKRCNMQHDKCHSTPRFQGSGQNLHIMGSSVKPKQITFLVEHAVDDWWGEYALVEDGNAMVDEFPKG